MSTAQRFDLGNDGADPEELDAAIDAAALAIQRGRLVVIPTDTVYGVAADAFDPEAVVRLLEAKGRGRDMPPPVLVGSPGTLDALAADVRPYVRALCDAFWPGPLTVVCTEQSSLQWDLGDTRGTVAVRMPDHEAVRQLLDRTGPLAVSSANLTGRPAATDADEAMDMLGDRVAVVVDGGPTPGNVPSTIVDATGERPRLLRLGAISVAELDRALAEHEVTIETDENGENGEKPEKGGTDEAEAPSTDA